PGRRRRQDWGIPLLEEDPRLSTARPDSPIGIEVADRHGPWGRVTPTYGNQAPSITRGRLHLARRTNRRSGGVEVLGIVGRLGAGRHASECPRLPGLQERPPEPVTVRNFRKMSASWPTLETQPPRPWNLRVRVPPWKANRPAASPLLY